MELCGGHLEARGERTDDNDERQNRENQGGEAGDGVGLDGHGLDPFCWPPRLFASGEKRYRPAVW